MFPNVEHRGTDAFGWMHYTGGKRPIQLRKFIGAASKGIDKVKEGSRTGIPKSSKWWIGHVRLATHGHESYIHNNHPIVHGDVMGVHNGICYNYDKVLKVTGRQFKKAEVDSEAIFAAVDKYGVFAGLNVIDALAATVFVKRSDPNTIYMATCDANPLIVGRSKGGAYYFASESWILNKLGIDWAEEPWRMDDYTVATIVNGQMQKYVQYADPALKWQAGYGSSYRSLSSPAVTVGGPARKLPTYNEWSFPASTDNQVDYWDQYTGGEFNIRPLEDGSTSTTTGFIPNDDDFMVHCLRCGSIMPEEDCDDGDCAKCGSFEWLVPFGTVTPSFVEEVQAAIDYEDSLRCDSSEPDATLPYLEVVRNLWHQPKKNAIPIIEGEAQPTGAMSVQNLEEALKSMGFTVKKEEPSIYV